MILVAGSLAYDKICNFDGLFEEHILPNRLDKLSVVFTLQKCRVEFGGTAGNIAYNLALLGESPHLISNTGSDFEIYKQHLKKMGVNIDLVKIYENEKTAECTIVNDLSNNQIGTFYDGALKHKINFTKLQNIKSKISAGISAPTSMTSLIDAVGYFQENNISYIFDPGQQIGNFNKNDFLECVRDSYVSIFNEYEWELAKKKFSINKEKILNYSQNLIVTLGENGAIIFNKNEEIHIPAIISKNVVDTVGCGDAFRAGVLYGIGRKWQLEKGCILGSKLATKALEQIGTQNHQLSESEKNDFLNI